MPNILALDTSTEACSVALSVDGHIETIYELAPRQHTERLLPMLKALLERCKVSIDDLDALAFGHGPGAFTGLRIATGTVQGLAFAANKPVVGVSTLQALAQQAHRVHKVATALPAIDARMDEIYWGEYRLEGAVMQPVMADQLSAAEAIVADVECGLGSGWLYADKISAQPKLVQADANPTAEDILRIAQDLYKQGKAVSAAQAQPVYLRNNVAKKKAEQKP